MPYFVCSVKYQLIWLDINKYSASGDNIILSILETLKIKISHLLLFNICISHLNDCSAH